MVESIYIHLVVEFICFRLFCTLQRLCLEIYRRQRGCTLSHCLCLMASILFITTFITFLTRCNPTLHLFVPILFLPVGYLSWQLVVWCPALCSQAPEGSSALWQQGDISRWHVRLQSAKSGGCLATGLQYCYITEARQHNNNRKTSLFFVNSHTTDAKNREKVKYIVVAFFRQKCLYQLIITGVLLEICRRIRACETEGRRKLVLPCLFHIRDIEHNWVNVFKYLSELIQPLWDGWYCT